MPLGTKLIDLRKRKQFTQKNVAEELNVSQPAYNKWESDLAKPSVDNLFKLCDFHAIDVYDLLEGVSNVSICNNKFEGSNIIYPYQSTINMQSNDLLNSVIKNQERITNLIDDSQNKLIEVLISKK